MSLERLTLQIEEPGEDPLSDQIFELVCKILQPDSQEPVDAIITQITALLPEGRPYSMEMSTFLMTCYEVAEQIPFDHIRMPKLVTTIDLCLNSARFPKTDGSNDMQTDPVFRYQKLSETLRDFWNTSYPRDSREKYINFQGFVARVYQRGLLSACTLPIFVLKQAFEEGHTGTDRDAYVMAASRYLLLGSHAIYEEIVFAETQKSRWQHWYRGLTTVVSGEADSSGEYSKETIELAEKAIVAMDAAQRLKSG